nr:MAG TPA: hypothetical protein [Caudoviricetes sp.]
MLPEHVTCNANLLICRLDISIINSTVPPDKLQGLLAMAFARSPFC